MFAKTENFTNDQQELARFAKLLSHPARVAILEYLAGQDACISGDISNELPLSRTTVSQHLQELRNSELIKGEISGLNVCYCIHRKNYNRMMKQFQKFFDKIQKANEQCC